MQEHDTVPAFFVKTRDFAVDNEGVVWYTEIGYDGVFAYFSHRCEYSF